MKVFHVGVFHIKLNKLCSKTAIKLYLQNLEQEISKMAIHNTKCKPSVN